MTCCSVPNWPHSHSEENVFKNSFFMARYFNTGVLNHSGYLSAMMKITDLVLWSRAFVSLRLVQCTELIRSWWSESKVFHNFPRITVGHYRFLPLLTGNYHVQDPRLLLCHILDPVGQALLPGHKQQPQQHHQGVPGQVLDGSCCLEPNADLSMSWTLKVDIKAGGASGKSNL